MKLVELLNIIGEYDDVAVLEANNEGGYDCLITGTAGQLPYRLVSKYADRKIEMVNASCSTVYIYLKK